MLSASMLLARLRDGYALEAEELAWFARGLADGNVSDAQAGAFAMAVRILGLGPGGTVALTLAMRDSGDCLRWDLPGPVLDKHSTGGIGDCTSLILAPALAVCGAYVPMISGRGLGHTGGTLDKLEAIPGLNVSQDERAFARIVGEVGCAIVSAGANLAPADRRLYAVRDVTATVESLDLITASILSKKLAAGLDSLVLDVKIGSGAFMKTVDAARALAQSLVGTAQGAGCGARALITDMSQPLAPTLGNALEVRSVMEVLTGQGLEANARLLDLSAALGGQGLHQAGICASVSEGEARLREAITSGAALERFAQMLTAQGVAADFCETWAHSLPRAPVERVLEMPRAGWFTGFDGQASAKSLWRLAADGRAKAMWCARMWACATCAHPARCWRPAHPCCGFTPAAKQRRKRHWQRCVVWSVSAKIPLPKHH